MKLSEIKTHLQTIPSVIFELQDGTPVPEHFHVTEIGLVAKHFIDCGGTVRDERVANFQLWSANDTHHRLLPSKLLNIITLSENVLGLDDLTIEVEYQTDTIGKYDLSFNGNHFILMPKQTACLASDNCGLPARKPKLALAGLTVLQEEACCSPEGGCC